MTSQIKIYFPLKMEMPSYDFPLRSPNMLESLCKENVHKKVCSHLVLNTNVY